MPQTGARLSVSTYANAFANFAQAVQPDPFKPMTQPDDPDSGTQKGSEIRQAMLTLTSSLGFPPSTLDVKETLGSALDKIGVPNAVKDACVEIDRQLQFSKTPTVRAAKVKNNDHHLMDLDHQLFPNANRNGFVSDALRGLLLALSMSKLSNGRSPLPVRGHLFFHNLQNLWACTNPHCTDHNVDVNARQNNPNPPSIGAIHSTHRLSCSCGSRVLDLIICEVCGEVFLGGYKTTRQIGRRNVEILTPDQADLEGVPDKLSQNQRSSRKLVIFSDSRQDAAKLSAGMERDHYRDMARSILIQSFNDYWKDLVAFLRVTCAFNPNSLNILQSLNPQLYTDVSQNPQADDQIRRNQFASVNSTLATEALSWVIGSPPINPQAHQEWIGLLQRYPNRVALQDLVKKKLEMIY